MRERIKVGGEKIIEELRKVLPNGKKKVEYIICNLASFYAIPREKMLWAIYLLSSL